MKNRLLICTLLPALTAFGSEVYPQSDVVKIEAGLWSYVSELSVVGQGVVHENDYEACLSEAQATINVEQMIADILEGDCTRDNFSHVEGEAKLEATCRNTEDQTVTKGSIVVQYSSTAYTGTANAKITGPGGSTDAISVTKANRLGDC